MNQKERGFLLLSSRLGNPERHPLTVAQLRVLAQRVQCSESRETDRDLTAADLTALGYRQDMAQRIVDLLAEEELLDRYLRRGSGMGCVPISRISPAYPRRIRQQLGADAPGCLWARGDLELLKTDMISLVGSRDLLEPNGKFAEAAGYQAARQGFTLVSGNARGSDRTAQNACLAAGGRVISVVADSLAAQPLRRGVLWLSEDGFDEPFSSARALSRNRVIHALGQCVLVAQCGYQAGGTWDGTVKNLRFGWSPVRIFRDDSAASVLLEEMGAERIGMDALADIPSLCKGEISLFDQPKP